MNTEHLSIAEMGRLLRVEAISSESLTRDALGRIRVREPRLHAFVCVTEERALKDAKRADADLKAGLDRGPMHGIPYALKDIYDTAGIATTCHSKLRRDHVPSEDSAVAARFAAGGAVLVGKLGTHEFAIGGPSFDLPWPVARNPWNTEHVTGGSSSGSGAAIAGGMLRMATGSDTGGSIRGPAAWCGTAGIKPTYGRVSCRGVFPLSWTLDHCGPLGRSVEDCAIALQVMAGYDPDDPASVDVPVPNFRAGLEHGVAGLRIGVPRAFFAEAKMVTSEVLAGIDRTIGWLRDAGATVEDVTLPEYAMFAIAGRVIMMAEAFAIHQADMRERMLDYGERTARRFVQGAALTAVDLVDALRARQELAAAVNGALQRYDALLTASSLMTAPRFDAMPDTLSSTAPMQTIPFNVTGHPAMSVPVGLAANGLPLSVQVVGRPFDEAVVLRVGRAVEKLSGWEEVALPFG